MSRIIAGLVAVLGLAGAAPAAAVELPIPLILDGNAGLGLLPGNENPAVSGGSGGLGPGGILIDTELGLLTLDVVWGSGNGFTDLTGNVIGLHIHGPTASPAPVSFGQNAGVLIDLGGLPGFNSSATDGGFSGSVQLTAEQVTQLLEGRFYINAHTAENPRGEIRGTMVPEPGTLALVAGGLLLFGAGRRRAR